LQNAKAWCQAQRGRLPACRPARLPAYRLSIIMADIGLLLDRDVITNIIVFIVQLQ
jgi:hypothetical protein